MADEHGVGDCQATGCDQLTLYRVSYETLAGQQGGEYCKTHREQIRKQFERFGYQETRLPRGRPR